MWAETETTAGLAADVCAAGFAAQRAEALILADVRARLETVFGRVATVEAHRTVVWVATRSLGVSKTCWC